MQKYRFESVILHVSIIQFKCFWTNILIFDNACTIMLALYMTVHTLERLAERLVDMVGLLFDM